MAIYPIINGQVSYNTFPSSRFALLGIARCSHQAGGNIPQHGKGLQVGEARHVELVVSEENLHATIALLTGKAQAGHVLIAQAEQDGKKGRLFRREKVGMQGHPRAESSLTQVEDAARTVVFRVGHKPQEGCEPRHEHHVEVGEALLGGIKPRHALHDETEERIVTLFVAGGVIEQLGKEKGDGQLQRMGRQPTKGMEEPSLTQGAQTGLHAVVIPYI